jgi:hypothetical protein
MSFFSGAFARERPQNNHFVALRTFISGKCPYFRIPNTNNSQ